MKNFLLSISIITMLASCSNGKKESLEVKTDLVPVNTAGYAISNGSTDVGSYDLQEEVNAPVQKRAAVRKKVAKTFSANEATDETKPVKQADKQISETKTVSGANNSGTTSTEQVSTNASGSNTDNANGETASSGNSTTGTEKAKKKGWSDAAKGAAIGGAAGAIGGAVINGKNRGAGAVIGAVIGAAGGYVIGRKMDKKKEANEFSMVVN